MPNDARDHRGDLLLVRPAIARHRCLDLGGRVEIGIQPKLGRSERCYSRCLRSPDDGHHIVLAKYLLDSNNLGCVRLGDFEDSGFDDSQSLP